AAHHHAEVACLGDYADAAGAEHFHQRVRNLPGHPLLHLKAPGEHLDDTRDFAEADDPPVRDVGHMYVPEKGQHVVLAHGIEFDVADDHHIVHVLVKDRAIHDIGDAHAIAVGQIGQRAVDPERCL